MIGNEQALKKLPIFQQLFGMIQIELGQMDSNHRMAGPKPAALPLGDAPTALQYFSDS